MAVVRKMSGSTPARRAPCVRSPDASALTPGHSGRTAVAAPMQTCQGDLLQRSKLRNGGPDCKGNLAREPRLTDSNAAFIEDAAWIFSTLDAPLRCGRKGVF